MKKLFLFITIFAMSLITIPRVMAGEENPTWKVEDITAKTGDSLVEASASNVQVDSENKTTITYSSGSFILLGATGTEAEEANTVSEEKTIDPSSTTQNRPDGYAWIGFTITRNNDSSSSTKLSVKAPGETEFTALTEGLTYTDFVGINVTKLKDALKEGKNVTYTYEFQTDGNDTYTVEIIIKPEGIILYPEGTDKNNLSAATISYNGPELKKELDEQAANQQTSSSESSATTDEKNPNTRDTIIYSAIAVVISVLGLTFIFKKVHNN